MELSRRDFMRAAALTGGAVTLAPGVVLRPWYAQAANGGIASPSPTYATPLVIPPAMPRAGTRQLRNGKNADLYRLSVRQFRQEIVPGDDTTVWSYVVDGAPGTFNYPAFTIEARWRRPVVVTWVNGLVDAQGVPLEHLLPVDPTLHWANPPGGTAGRDSRPMFDTTPDRYRGPVPIVTHVHGAAKVGDESDGYAEAWFLPKSDAIPAGFATEGTWYRFFRDKAMAATNGWGYPGETWARGEAVFSYPNDQAAATLWYHDHTLGMTRLNVYAGPAGFYLIRGGPGDNVLDARTGGPAKLPGPAPRRGDRGNKPYREIPIVVQDRSFSTSGELFYPDTRAFFDGFEGPYLPDTPVSPIWNPEFFGNSMVVNGKAWPRLTVEKRRYRFRLLNGCDSRYLILRFSDPRVKVWQIGAEGGFLPEPLDLNAVADGTILLGLAERADVIVDFAGVPANEEVFLLNVGPDEPFKGFNPDGSLADGDGGSLDPADPRTTGQVLRFDVVPTRDADDSTPPQRLRFPRPAYPSGGSARRLALIEEEIEIGGEAHVTSALLGRVVGGRAVPEMWADPITENPAGGATEVWQIANTTADVHPIHIHEVLFQVVNRQPIHVSEEAHAITAAGPARPPEPWESGLKDTVNAYPGEVTRVRMRFEREGNYVWHCHIVSHEDNEMMRPYRIGPVQPGSPEAMGART
jgi:spore coat protein A, manganese oxidase